MPSGSEAEAASFFAHERAPSHTSVASCFEEKVCALSRRTAAEIERADRERGEQARRLENLETWCRERLTNLPAGASQERFDGEFRHISETVLQVREALEMLTVRVDSELRGPVSWEAALAQERREVRELLSASCSELTGHLNALREELLKQREAADLHVKHLDGWRHSAAMSLSAGAGLEAQVAELGGVLAARLQAKISSVSDIFNEKIEDVRSEFQKALQLAQAASGKVVLSGMDWSGRAPDFSSVAAQLQDLVKKEAEQMLEVARDEVRTVHLEVMSVDTRVAAVEERLRHSSSRPRSVSPMSGRALRGSASDVGLSECRPGEAPRIRTGHLSSLGE